MTLCIAAISVGTRYPSRDLSFAIVTVTDQRVETNITGGNFGGKQMPIAQDGQWHCLYSDIVSAAHHFTNTLRTELHPQEFTSDNLLDNLSEASSVHQQKLIERFVQMRLGMSFEHFRTHGEAEVPADIRQRTWHEIQRLDYECELIVCGFLGMGPHLFMIDSDGDVERADHFATIGSGSPIAESVLYQREQQLSTELNQTLYNVYEAYRLGSKAPGVAGDPVICVYEPELYDPTTIVPKPLRPSALKILAKCFDRYGPKKARKVPTFTDEHFIELPKFFYKRAAPPEPAHDLDIDDD